MPKPGLALRLGESSPWGYTGTAPIGYTSFLYDGDRPVAQRKDGSCGVAGSYGTAKIWKGLRKGALFQTMGRWIWKDWKTAKWGPGEGT